jgi:hypothetical protein
MAKSQAELVQAQYAVRQADEALAKAKEDRRAAKSDDPAQASLNAAVDAAKQALTDAEVKLRRIYEAKDHDDFSWDGRPRYRLG